MTLTFLDRFRPHRRDQILPVFEGLAQVRAYWEGLRKDGMLPVREAIDPRGLSGVLDRVFLATRIAPGLVQVSLAGSGISALAGMDLRGLPLSCLFAADSRPLLAQALERVLSEATIAELDLGVDRGIPGAMVARLLLLPLADQAGGKLVLGALSHANGRQGQGKFQILARREERMVIPPRTVPDEGIPMVEPIRRFGHLSLVHSCE
ncbi:MAG: PAS domain-containing protein [Tabrizicola sp.]|nr:PAS domain-containing protein [Tabrizicola sp.]